MDLIDPIESLSRDHAEGDWVARLQTGQFIGVFNIEGHRHGIHVAGDFFVLDGDFHFRRGDGDDDAFPLIKFLVGQRLSGGDGIGGRLGRCREGEQG